MADLREIEDRLERPRNAYDAAFNKLVDGRGNLIRNTERLREPGVSPSKALFRRLWLRLQGIEAVGMSRNQNR